MFQSILPTPEHREFMDKVFLATITVMLTVAIINIIFAIIVYFTGEYGVSMAQDLMGHSSTKGGSQTLKVTKKKLASLF
jgi:hypothetical protein